MPIFRDPPLPAEINEPMPAPRWVPPRPRIPAGDQVLVAPDGHEVMYVKGSTDDEWPWPAPDAHTPPVDAFERRCQVRAARRDPNRGRPQPPHHATVVRLDGEVVDR